MLQIRMVVSEYSSLLNLTKRRIVRLARLLENMPNYSLAERKKPALSRPILQTMIFSYNL